MRRNDMDICHDILKVAETGAKKTRIVYQANLNFKIVKKYLELLMSRNFIELKDRHYLTTDSGHYWMTNYNQLVSPMKGVLSESEAEAPQM